MNASTDQAARIKEIAEKISNFINSANRDEIKVLGSELTFDHRTLVQNKALMVQAFIGVLALNYTIGEYDARNEAACKWAHDVMTKVGLPPLPFI